MEHRDAALGPELAQAVFQLASLIHRFVDEGFDDWLAERRELAATEAAEEALHAGEPDAVNFDGLLAEDCHAGAVEDLADLFGLAAFVIMVAEHAEHRDCCTP